MVYRWNGYLENESSRSLLRYIDTDGERLRRKYVKWIHDLGEYRIAGKSIIDHLAFDDIGFSYWWMTLFVEQSPWKSPSLAKVIRLLALEEIILAERPAIVRVVGAESDVDEVLRAFCRSSDISYESLDAHDDAQAESIVRRVYHSLPHSVRALVYLTRHTIDRWALRRADTSGWFDGDHAVFFASYFIHLDQQATARGEFHSRHWENLTRLIRDHGLETNWLQHFLKSNVVPTTTAALTLARELNAHSSDQGFHTFLDAYLSGLVLLRVARQWLTLLRIAPRTRDIRAAFTPSESRLDLWPVVRDDWWSSTRGVVAADNLLWIALFDKALGGVPRQATGLYLHENQAWERAFIHAWRKHGHGYLVGVAHSTVRFWDLRYFVDPRTTQSSAPNHMPTHDAIALNGNAAIDAYQSLGELREGIVECEALRYGELFGRPEKRTSPIGVKQLKVLVLTDYHPAGTISMLRMLEAAAPGIARETQYTVKPHPNYMVDPKDYPSLEFEVVTDSLWDILRNYDVAYSSNNTSAAVDAYFAGLPVVVSLDQAELNFSPLRGRSRVRFAGTPAELAEALQADDARGVDAPSHEGFFFLDPELPRWKRLLALDARDRR
jgi:surface carbohydrate biosynthesis protein (TIGR04326 family)